MAVEINGRSIAVFNVNGRFYGLLNRCPHRGADLCAGRFVPLVTSTRPGEYRYDPDQPMLACPWHGWEFDVTTGQSYFDPTHVRGRPYAVSAERGDLVAAELDSGEVAVTPEQYAALAGGRDADDRGRLPGPYLAETVTVEVEDEYLVVDLRPVRVAPSTERKASS